MYAIISQGILISLCDRPRYVRINPDSGAYVQTDRKQAEGIAVNGKLYNLPGSSTIPDAPEAYVSNGDAGEFVFRNRLKIRKESEATGAAIIEVESALCEIDAVNDERMSALENAVCELDAAISK